MKTVIKMNKSSNILAPLAFFVGLGLLIGAPVQAADVSAPASNPPSVPSLNTPPKLDPLPETTATANLAEPSVSPIKIEKPVDSKSANSIKDTIRKVENSNSVSLEDLNTVRQMIAKIDVLIEAEKRLAELDKIRNQEQHESFGSKTSLASVIPASAISPMPLPPVPQYTPTMAQPAPVMPAPAPAADLDIVRIIGSGGHYVAVVKVDGQSKKVQVGDHLNGGTVVGITSTSIEFDPNKVKPVVYVKNVENVFGSGR